MVNITNSALNFMKSRLITRQYLYSWLNDSVGMSVIMSSSPALLSAVCVCCRLCLVPPISGGFSLPEECSGQPPLPLPPDHLLPAHSPVLTTASSTTVASRWSNRKQIFHHDATKRKEGERKLFTKKSSHFEIRVKRITVIFVYDQILFF